MTLKPTSSQGGGGGGSTPFPVQAGDGSPIDNTVTPTGIGSLYADTTNGGMYFAVGATDADWVSVAGETAPVDTAAPGVYSDGSLSLLLAAAASARAQLTDAAAFENSGNSLIWKTAGGGDGTQTLTVQTGSTGQYQGTLQDEDGNMTVPGRVLAFQQNTSGQQTVTGVLSAVVDLNAQAVLSSIISALADYGFVVDGTT